jgi:hypothetical protein
MLEFLEYYNSFTHTHIYIYIYIKKQYIKMQQHIIELVYYNRNSFLTSSCLPSLMSSVALIIVRGNVGILLVHVHTSYIQSIFNLIGIFHDFLDKFIFVLEPTKVYRNFNSFSFLIKKSMKFRRPTNFH